MGDMDKDKIIQEMKEKLEKQAKENEEIKKK